MKLILVFQIFSYGLVESDKLCQNKSIGKNSFPPVYEKVGRNQKDQ
jgi:hypothetical protein